MMPAKKIILQAPAETIAVVLGALEEYAYAAYPPGGSECAQVSRQTILDAVAVMRAQQQQGEPVSFSSRLRAQFKAALRYHVEQQQLSAQRYALLEEVLKGNALDVKQWQAHA